MPSHSIAFYEEQFKTHIMQAFLGVKTNCLKSILHELIRENEKDYKMVNYAYLNVKKELVGNKVY